MTVYVDDWRQPARARWVNRTWSHLFVGPHDDLEELHAFAARIGLSPDWFQDEPWPLAHYCVTEPKRRQAVAAGTVPITWREAARRMREALSQARAGAGSHDHAPAEPRGACQDVRA